MYRSLLVASLGTLALLLAACGAPPTPTPTRVPYNGDISTLLESSEVARVSGVHSLEGSIRDLKAITAAADPSQVVHMDSFTSLSFNTSGKSKSLLLTTIDFDSPAAAVFDAARLMDSSMFDLVPTIGEVSSFVEVNAGGIGSMVSFRKGEWVVMLHTSQPDGTEPLVDLAGLTALAQLVADRL